MNAIDWFYIFLSGLPFGFLVILIWKHFEKNLTLQKTKTEGEHILQIAKEQADKVLEKQKKEFHLFSQKTIQSFEREKETLTQNIKNLQIHMEKKKSSIPIQKKRSSPIFP